MLHYVFAVYDSKSSVYMRPFISPTYGEGLRAIEEGCNDQKSYFFKFANDFELFDLGRWDDSNAVFAAHTSPVSLGRLTQYIRKHPTESFHADMPV